MIYPSIYFYLDLGFRRLTEVPASSLIKLDNFDILSKGQTDCHCKIRETLYIQGISQLSMSTSEVKS